MLSLAYNAAEKVDAREDWQKSGKYRYCHAVTNLEGNAFSVEYCEWGSSRAQYVTGFASYSAAIMHARGMNIKDRK